MASAAAAPAPDLSLNGLVKSDAALKDSKDFVAQLTTFNKVASDASVAACAKKLNEVKHKATVVDSAKAAVDLVASLIPQNASVGFGYSTTFNEIGLNDMIKGRADLKNFRAIALAAEAKNDWAGAGAARAEGAHADYFLTSANAVSEDGVIVLADASLTRVPGVLSGKNVILVVGANKVVPTEADAKKRLHDFVLPLESARVRVVFKAPASAINNEIIVRAASPWSPPGRIHIIIIKGQSYGF